MLLQKVSFSQRSLPHSFLHLYKCWKFNSTCISSENFLKGAFQIELQLSIALVQVTAGLFECCSESCHVAYYSSSLRVENRLGDGSRKSCFAYSILLMCILKRIKFAAQPFPALEIALGDNFFALTGTHPLSGLVVERTCDVDGTCHVLHREGAAYVTAGNLVPNSRGWKLKQRAR